MLLNDKERDRFAAYCEQTAFTSTGILEQLEKISGPVMDELMNREKQNIAAFKIVAIHLRSGESVTVGT